MHDLSKNECFDKIKHKSRRQTGHGSLSAVPGNLETSAAFQKEKQTWQKGERNDGAADRFGTAQPNL